MIIGMINILQTRKLTIYLTDRGLYEDRIDIYLDKSR